jgi:hypothetical protein
MVGFGRQMDAGAINWTLLHLSTQNLTGHSSDFATNQAVRFVIECPHCFSAVIWQ